MLEHTRISLCQKTEPAMRLSRGGHGGRAVRVHLRKKGIEANVRAGDRDFCGYESALYSSP
jgi:hypothetical protein